MNSYWTIIADDFTGAGDSAVQFGSVGKPVRLLLDAPAENIRSRILAAIVVDTETRFLSADEAYIRVAAVTLDLRKAGSHSFYKKIDSTLRGNPADEIAAVMDAAGYRFAVVAPSAPLNKRTVVNGICYVDGQPLSATAAAHDPFTPVTESRIANILERRFPGAVRELRLDLVRAGKNALESRVAEGISNGARVFVADAETIADLKAIAELSSQVGVLFVGSSGLADAIAKKDAGQQSSLRLSLPRFPRGKTLFVNGSVTPTSNIQCECLLRLGGVFEITVNSMSALSAPSAERKRLLDLLAKAPSRNSLLIRTSRPDGPEANDLSIKEAGVAISCFLGDLALEAARLHNVRFLFASGGDTAARIMKVLGAESIDFVSEIFPGLPFGYFHSVALGRRIYFISKSGGFGDQDAMAKSLTMVSPAFISIKEQRS
ncbi:MAG: four-carbon acid sugar kinase family protein [Rectinemataceae bacterium]